MTAIGVRGLSFVLPGAVLLAVGAGGPQTSAVVLGPLILYALGPIAVVAFWWENWPGARLGASLSGWANTVLIAAAGVVLAAAGQCVAGGLDIHDLFTPTRSGVPMFPATLPLAALVFGSLLQITVVGEGWPLKRLPGLLAGAVALALAWAISLGLFFWLADIPSPAGSRVIARSGPVPGADIGAAVACLGAWQVLGFVVLRSLSGVASRARRLAGAHALVLGGALATTLALRAVLDAATVSALAGCVIAGGLLTGMLFEVGVGRVRGLVVALVAAAAVFALLSLIADQLTFTRIRPDEWVTHASLNALATSTILHVAIGRRWPFSAPRAVPARRPAAPAPRAS